jgi:type IV pilus assembly protein PilM
VAPAISRRHRARARAWPKAGFSEQVSWPIEYARGRWDLGSSKVRPSVGLDIGSSAVRAAEVSTAGGRPELVRFAQVGLPAGAVVEGEVKDKEAVVSALRHLWSAGGFRGRDVVLGISSQRSMVRVIEIPKVQPAELRSAIRYQLTELLPIGVDEAVFDFSEIGPGERGPDGPGVTQVLLVVVQKEVVLDYIEVLRRAGLRARAVDSSALAVLRAVPCASLNGLEAVVCLGANLVTVSVRQGSLPQFVRTVARGAEGSANPRQDVAFMGSQRSGRGNRAPAAGGRLAQVAEEVRGSLEYFHSHSQDAKLARVVLTGGGALEQGVVELMSSVLGLPVEMAELAVTYDPKRLGLTERQVANASGRWATAVGLALWGWGQFPAPSLVPEEVRERQQFQRGLVATAAGIFVLAGALGVVSYHREVAASRLARQVAVEQADATSLERSVAKLQPSVSIQADVRSRLALVDEALVGDIGWVSLVERIERALPAGVKLDNLSLGRSSTPAAPASASQSANAGMAATSTANGADLGQVSMSLTAYGGPDLVAKFVRNMWDVRGLYALWVPGTTTESSGASEVTRFSATAQLTSAALSERALSAERRAK